MTPNERPTARLRRLLQGPGCVPAPEAADGLTARLIARAGFQALYVSGGGTSLNRLGLPGAGLLTATEMVDNASRIFDACGLAVVADAGTGYGNPINVRRTVRDFEKAGVAALHIEDQGLPAAEMVAKIRAACDARRDPDLVLIARAGAAERARSYREAGADMILVDALAHAAARDLAGIPLACRVAAGAAAFPGCKLALHTDLAVLAAIPRIEHMLSELKKRGGIGHLRGEMANFAEFTEIAGIAEVQELENRYGVPEEQRTRL